MPFCLLNRRGTFSWEGSRISKDCGGHSIVDVNVSFSKKYRRRRFSTICPVEIGSFESIITISRETALEKDQKAAYREIRQFGKRLRGIESAICSLGNHDEE